MPKHKRGYSPAAKLMAVALSGILFLTGCQTGSAGASEYTEPAPAAETLLPLAELDLLENPKTYQGGSTAILSAAQPGSIISDAVVRLPVTVTSFERAGNREVTVTDTSRVIALSMNGSLASTVLALGLGDQLVGRDIVTDEPELEHLPVVTKSGHTLEAESIIGLNPSLIITDGSIGPIDVLLQLRDAGITIVFVERDSSFEGSYRVTEQIAAALGAAEAGEELAETLRAEVEAKVAEIAAIAPDATEDRLRMAFLYVRGTAKIYYLFGAESGADTLIDALGGVDIAGENDWIGMRPITDEAIIKLNPDLVLVMTDGLSSVGGVEGLFDTLPALKLTNAGQNNRVVDMDDTEVLGFGPRMPDVLDALARAIYAPETR